VIFGCRRKIILKQILRRMMLLIEQRTFPLTYVSIPAQGTIQPPIQWVPDFFPMGKARPGRDADHSLISSAELKNE
jgi:hypothetical protein